MLEAIPRVSTVICSIREAPSEQEKMAEEHIRKKLAEVAPNSTYVSDFGSTKALIVAKINSDFRLIHGDTYNTEFNRIEGKIVVRDCAKINSDFGLDGVCNSTGIELGV